MFENVTNMWAAYNNSQVDIIGPGAFPPNRNVSISILRNTLDKVWKEWEMESTWGWDAPWLAMACA